MKRIILPAALVFAGLVSVLLYFFDFGKDTLDVKISNASYIMPAAYKVYSNEQALNGEYYFFKMLMTNEGTTSLKDVKVSYEVPGYVDMTELVTIPEIYPGQHVVVKCYPHFKDNIVQKMTQSQETGNIKIEYNGNKTKKETFGFNMMGRNQFVYTDIPMDEVTSYPDMMHNTQLLPCLITPEDPIVKYYTAAVQDKFMQGEAASVSNTDQDAVKFLAGLYSATVATHMVYSGTEGIPQKLGDINSTVQSTRLPREVITGNTGLCIELSLFYASVLKAAGLHPVIFLIPGHAFPGVLVNNNLYAIEATGVNGGGLGGVYSAAQAYNRGAEELKTFIQAAQQGDTRYIYIDVNDLESRGVIPMELADDEFLRKKVDDLTANFGGGGSTNFTAANTTARTTHSSERRSSGGGGGNSSALGNYFSGPISFSYPGSWGRRDYPVAQLNTLVAQVGTSDAQTGISIWNVQASTPDQALYIIRTQLAAFQQYIQYQKTGSSNGYTMYQGVTNYSGGQRRWEGVFRSGGNGVAGITLSSPNFAGYQGLFNQIISTVR
ncbi:MAG: hypothetical protein JST19_05625 [Bacteroidetes bacterium]|nr:hypothetical protein [Bacteroidota bacterium]